MSEPINYKAKEISTGDAKVTFGHVNGDGVISGFKVVSNTESPVPHYFQMDRTGDTRTKGRGGGTIHRCPGTFQVKAGDAVAAGIPGVFIDSGSGDLVLISSGRIRIAAQDIDIIATGSGGEHGVININANEKIIIDSKQSVLVRSNVDTTIFSEKTTEIIGNSILNMYGGFVEMFDGATSLKGSAGIIPFLPATPREILQAVKNKISLVK